MFLSFMDFGLNFEMHIYHLEIVFLIKDGEELTYNCSHAHEERELQNKIN